MMSIPEILTSDLNLVDLTESEQDAIVEVLKRDLELRRQESERIQNLRAEVNLLHTLAAQWQSKENPDGFCLLCHVEFGWLFNRGDRCPQCNAKVCDKCLQSTATKDKWLCLLCFKQRNLKAQSGSWLCSKFPQIRKNNSPSLKLQHISDAFAGTERSNRSGEIDGFTNNQQHSNVSAKTHSVESVTFPKDSDKELLAKLLETQSISKSSSTELTSSCELDQMVHQQNLLNNHQSESQSNLFSSTGKHPFRIIWPELDSSEGELLSKERQIGGNPSSISVKGFEHEPLSGLKGHQAEHLATESIAGRSTNEIIEQKTKYKTDLEAKKPNLVSHQIPADDDDDSLSVSSEKTEPDTSRFYSESHFQNHSESDCLNQHRRRNHLKRKPFPASAANQRNLDVLINELVHKEILLSGEKHLEKSDSFNSIAEHNQLLIGYDSFRSDVESDLEKREKSLNEIKSNVKVPNRNMHYKNQQLAKQSTDESSSLNKAKRSSEPRSPVECFSNTEQLSREDSVIYDSHSQCSALSSTDSNHWMSAPAYETVESKKESREPNQLAEDQEYSNNQRHFSKCDAVKLKLEKPSDSMKRLPKTQEQQHHTSSTEAVKVLGSDISENAASHKTCRTNVFRSDLKTHGSGFDGKLDSVRADKMKKFAKMQDSISNLVNEEAASDDLEAEIDASAAYNEMIILETESDVEFSESFKRQDKKFIPKVNSDSLETDTSAACSGKICFESGERQPGIDENSESNSFTVLKGASSTRQIIVNEPLRTVSKKASVLSSVDPCAQSSYSDEEMQKDENAADQEYLYHKKYSSSSKETSGNKRATPLIQSTEGQNKKLQRDDAFEEGVFLDRHNAPHSQIAVKASSAAVSGVELSAADKQLLNNTDVSFNEPAESELSRSKVLSPVNDKVQISISVDEACAYEDATDVHLAPENEAAAASTGLKWEKSSEETDSIDEAFLAARANPSALADSRRLQAVSQESIVSLYSHSGKGRLGRISVAGEVEIGVKYNDSLSCVEISVRRCRDLAMADVKKQRTDPYVKTYLLPDKSRSSKRKTCIKKNTVNPVYNEVMRYVLQRSDLERRTVWVSVWHFDRFGRNDFLGDVVIPLNDQTLNEPEPQWFRLEQEAGMKWKSVLSLTSKADLDIALKYTTIDQTSKGKGKQKKPFAELLVNVKTAHNLSAVLGNSHCNAFCICRLLPEQPQYGKQKTRVVKQSLSPTWNHTFTLTNLALEDLMKSSLELTVWDYDRFKSNEFLGGVRLSLGSPTNNSQGKDWFDSSEEEIAVWRNMLDHPNNWIEATIQMRTCMD